MFWNLISLSFDKHHCGALYWFACINLEDSSCNIFRLWIWIRCQVRFDSILCICYHFYYWNENNRLSCVDLFFKYFKQIFVHRSHRHDLLDTDNCVQVSRIIGCWTSKWFACLDNCLRFAAQLSYESVSLHFYNAEIQGSHLCYFFKKEKFHQEAGVNITSQ